MMEKIASIHIAYNSFLSDQQSGKKKHFKKLENSQKKTFLELRNFSWIHSIHRSQGKSEPKQHDEATMPTLQGTPALFYCWKVTEIKSEKNQSTCKTSTLMGICMMLQL